MSRISVAKGSNLNFRGRKSNSLMNLCGKTAPSHSVLHLYIFFFRVYTVLKKTNIKPTTNKTNQNKNNKRSFTAYFCLNYGFCCISRCFLLFWNYTCLLNPPQNAIFGTKMCTLLILCFLS